MKRAAASSPTTWPKWPCEVAAALGIAAGSLWATFAVGEFSARQLDRRDHDEIEFSAIDCPVPAGVSRKHFLQEVQYLGAFPDRLELGDEDVIDRLANAFRAHPAVRDVPSITIGRGPILRVALGFSGPRDG